MESDTEAATLDDAISYITRIKVHYSGNPVVYNRFLEFLKEYRTNQEMDTRGYFERLTHLFIGHPALIQGFNAFLPPGYRIECGTEENPDTFRVTTPSGITTQTLQRPVGTSDLVLSNDPEHPANLIPELCAAFYKLGWVSLNATLPMSDLIKCTGHRHWRRSLNQSLTAYLHRPLRRPEGTHKAQRNVCPFSRHAQIPRQPTRVPSEAP